MFVFVYTLIFWIYLPQMRQNMKPFSFWARFTSLNIISSNCIHLPSNDTPLLTMAEQNSIVHIYHNFLIHSSVVGQLSCFHSLTVVNSVGWMLVYKCLYCILSYVPLGRCPGAISLNHEAILFLAVWGISTLLSIKVVLICIPTNSV
jgi:hypothetical protein